MATRSSSSLFIVLLLTSALFVSISSITVPEPVLAAGTIVPNPVSGSPGKYVTITGAGWAAYAAGTGCTLSSAAPGMVTSQTCTIGPGGTIFGGFIVGSVPGNPAGYDVFAAVGSDVSPVGVKFIVVPGISVSPIQGPPSIHVTVSGGGFQTTGGCALNTFPANIISPGSDVCIVSGTGNTIASGSGFNVDPAAAAGPYSVFVTLAPDGPTQAPFTVVLGPSVVVAPSTGAHGLTVTVSGPGFSLSDTSASMSYTALAPGGALWSGTITPTLSVSGPFKVASATFTVASSATVGVTYRIRIQGSTGDSGDTSAVGDFGVVADPTVTAGAAFGPAGTPVGLSTGAGDIPFSPLDVGICTMSSTLSQLIPAGSPYVCQIDSFGNLLGGSSFVVPSTAPGGNYLVKVTGSKGDSATIGFVVKAAVTFDQSSGYPPITAPATAATRVKVTGTGFASADSSGGCQITTPVGDSLGIDTSGETCTVSSSTGQLSAYFKVKKDSYYNAGAPARTVTVTGLPNSDFATATFTVLPRIKVSPDLAGPTTVINYGGSGFTNTPNPGGCVAGGPDITGIPVAAAPAPTCFQDAGGNVWGQFTVAAVVSGFYVVTYWDATGVGPTESTALTVTGGPIVNLSQYTGPTGTTVTVSGSGFNPTDANVQISTSAPPDLFSPTPLTCSVSGGNIASGCTFTVKSTAPGLAGPGGYLLVIKGNLGDSANANFLLTTTFFINPSNGGVNTANLQISGTGYFAGMGACLGSWYESPAPLINVGVSSCNIDPNGVLSGTVSILPAGVALGAHTVGINNPAFVVQTLVTNTFTVTVPTLVLAPNTGTGGDTIQFTGTGFSSGDTVFTLDAPATSPIESYTYSISGGVVSGSFKVLKAGNPAQVTTLTLHGNLVDSAAAGFTVVPQISHTLTPGGSAGNPARVGATVTVTGSNFAVADLGVAGAQITGAAVTAAPVFCDVAADYTINCAFTVLLTFAGATDLITATGTTSLLTATATLYVMPHTVTLNPTHGPLGASISVTATGFSLTDICGAGGSVLDASAAVTGWVCSVPTGGTITGSFVVGGAVTPSTITLTLTGGPDGDVGTATFTLDPGMLVLPNSGRPGTTVLVSGTNFVTPGDTGCSISSTPSGLISSPLCTVAGGAMSGSFTVAAGTSGSYTVNVAGTTGDTAHATFNVPPPPSMTVTPNPANPGSVVTAAGTNFVGTTCLLTASPSNLFSASPSCSIAAGTLSATFTVASGASGSYTVTVNTNAGSGDSATSDLSVSPGPVPTLTLTPPSGGAGAVVSGTGTGFTADVTCVLSAAPSTILSSASCTVTGGGGFTVGFTVSSGASVGTYAILAVGNTGKAASQTFEVTPSGGRTLDLTPTSGRAGTAVTVSGLNYVGTMCTLSSTPTNIITSQTCSISAGTLTGGFTVAAGATGGVYTVTVTTDIPADTVSVSFTVPSPTLTLAPTSGASGTVVTASGSNYAGTGTCTLTPTPSTLFISYTCSISGTGVLSGSFTVDSGARARSYTVAVTTSISGETVSASFSVPAPTLALTPNSAAAGTAVGISGTNYAGTGACTLSSSPSGLISSPTCAISGGILDGGFIVASGATIGSYTVTVTTNISGETASATFTVPSPSGTKTFTLSPNSGRPGTTVSISGSNYVGSTCSLSSSPSGLLSSPTCSIASGTLTGGFTVASAATAGGYTVTVTTNISGETVSTTFTVPSLKPCIIATATFGSEASPAVQYLRNFRDGLVLSTRAGSAFMDVFNAWYYSFSPSVANFIASNDPLRAPIRVMLYPLLGILTVSTLAYSMFTWAPELGVVMAGLVASSLIGLVYLTAPALIGMRALLRRRRLSAKTLAKASLASLAVALTLLTIGEVAGSFLLLAVAGSAVVLICIAAVPTIAALMMTRTRPQ